MAYKHLNHYGLLQLENYKSIKLIKDWLSDYEKGKKRVLVHGRGILEDTKKAIVKGLEGAEGKNYEGIDVWRKRQNKRLVQVEEILNL